MKRSAIPWKQLGLRILAITSTIFLVALSRPGAVDDETLAAVQHPQAVNISLLAARFPPRVARPVAVPRPDFRGSLSRTHTRLARQAAVHAAVAALHRIFWLHGRGMQLYTAWNTPFRLKAINWYGFEYAPYVPGGLDHVRLDSILRLLHRLHFNAIRLLFADATVESNPIIRRGVAANPRFKGLRALDVMQRILERAHHFGIRVILCNSRSEFGMGPEIKTGLWYTNRYPAAAWERDWITLATRFRHDSAFVGADLRNEPHIAGARFDQEAYFKLGPLWGAYNGTYYHDRDWHYAAETMGNELLGINPHLLIIVEGVQIYYDPFRGKLTGGLWGSNLVGVQYDPIVLSHRSQLVYSAHEYGPKMYRAKWFNPRTTYARLARRWRNHWGYLFTAPKFMQAPIFIGEFGTCNYGNFCVDDPAKPAGQGFWFHSFSRYLLSHPQVSWAYWSLNPVGPFYAGENNSYSLVEHDWRHVSHYLLPGLHPLLDAP